MAGKKSKSLGGRVFGNSNGSGFFEGVNLARIRSILSVKNSRKEFARVEVSSAAGREFGGVRCKIELRVFHRERGFDDDSETRLEKKIDLALLISFRTSLH